MGFPDAVREPALTKATARAAFTEAAARVPDEPPPDEACDGTGVIIPGGGARYLPGAYVTTALLRRLGWALPIEIWYLGAAEMPDRWRARFDGLGAVTVDAPPAATSVPNVGLGRQAQTLGDASLRQPDAHITDRVGRIPRSRSGCGRTAEH